MFDNLKIGTINGLSEGLLLNLGKINIICGKNNSGKSTVLEGIRVDQSRFSGRFIKGAQIDQICTYIFRNTQGLEFNVPRFDRLREIVEMVASEKLWLSGEAFAFAKELVIALQDEPYFSRAKFSEGSLSEMFNGLFAEDPTKIILIPPKRHLEIDIRIDSVHISRDGMGILNYLFFSKNQNGISNDYSIYQQISKAFFSISSGYHFDIFMDKSPQIKLFFSNKSSNWISADNCGLGLQDLLVILYFAIHPDYEVLLIEEPELHMHPDMQRRLLSFLKETSGKQFFISTHSNIFLNNALVDRIFFTRFTDSVQIDDATAKASILNDLGYSVADNLISDLIILVEGPSDTPVIEEFLVKLGLFGKYDIKTWPLGGDIMDQVDFTFLLENYSVIGLVDSDPKSAKIRNRFIKKCQEHNVYVHKLQRYSIENYFSLRALREVFSVQIPSPIISILPEIKLEEQIGMDVKKRNRKIAEEMAIDEIENTDLRKFFTTVETICKQKTQP